MFFFHPRNASEVSQLQLIVHPLPNNLFLSIPQKEPLRKNSFSPSTKFVVKLGVNVTTSASITMILV